MSVLPWTMMAPSRSISRSASTVAPGSGPFITRSPAIIVTSGFSFLSAFRTASSAGRLPWTSERTAMRVVMRTPRAASSQHAFGRDDEAEEPLAGNLAIDGGDTETLAEPAAELLHRDLEAEDIAGHHDPLESHIVDPGEQPDPVAEPGLLRHVDRHRLRERLDLEDARENRQAREMALRPELRRGNALDPDDPLRLGVVFH